MKLRQLNKLQRFLSLLDSNNIAYVSWKNKNHNVKKLQPRTQDILCDVFNFI